MHRTLWRVFVLLVWLVLMLLVMSGCRTGGTLVLSTTIQGVDVSYVVAQ